MTGADDAAGRGGPTTPTWLVEACPPWCVREHREDDHPEDRYHQSEPATFAALAGSGDAVPLTDSLAALVLGVRLGRHLGDRRTWLSIEALEARRPRLVLAEASARALLAQVRAQLAQLDEQAPG